MEDSKECTTCHKILSLDNFHHTEKGKNRRAGKCKVCRSLQAKEHYQRNVERIRLKQTTPEFRERKRAYLLGAKYGISKEHYEKMLSLQSGCCKICGGFLVSPHVDHNHLTGFVRGLLCADCNRGLGCFKDSPDFLITAAEYLKEEYE